MKNMKVKKIITATVNANIEIEEITLLSIEEYEKYLTNIKPLNTWWWLRSPGFYVCDDIYFNYGAKFVNHPDGAVRPALRLNPDSHHLQIGDVFEYENKRWTMIADSLALCDEAFCNMAYRKDWQAKDANDYNASDVKMYLDNWIKYRKIEIKGITLLSTDEYDECKANIKPLKDRWWLRAPGDDCNIAAFVTDDVSFDVLDIDGANGSVRPALQIKAPNLNIGDVFEFGKKQWTVISTNLALSDEPFFKMAFHKVLPGSKTSMCRLKEYLEGWFADKI